VLKQVQLHSLLLVFLYRPPVFTYITTTPPMQKRKSFDPSLDNFLQNHVLWCPRPLPPSFRWELWFHVTFLLFCQIGHSNMKVWNPKKMLRFYNTWLRGLEVRVLHCSRSRILCEIVLFVKKVQLQSCVLLFLFTPLQYTIHAPCKIRRVLTLPRQKWWFDVTSLLVCVITGNMNMNTQKICQVITRLVSVDSN
jgi:hypothetical protein